MTRLTLFTLTALLCVILVLTAAATATATATESYTLQRRIGVNGEWERITAVTVSRYSIDSPVKLKVQQPGEVELSGDKRKELAVAQFVHYRLVHNEAGEEMEAASIALSPCTLVRGFEAIDSRSVVLREVLRIAVGPGTKVVGLLGISETNTFHAKMLDGDECDCGILTLFQRVLVQTSVELLGPTSSRSLPDYMELDKIMNKNGPKVVRQRGRRSKAGEAAAGAALQDGEQFYQNPQLHDGGDGETEKGEGEEEVNRSFLEKYWVYLVMPIAFSVIQNVLSNRQN